MFIYLFTVSSSSFPHFFLNRFFLSKLASLCIFNVFALIIICTSFNFHKLFYFFLIISHKKNAGDVEKISKILNKMKKSKMWNHVNKSFECDSQNACSLHRICTFSLMLISIPILVSMRSK